MYEAYETIGECETGCAVEFNTIVEAKDFAHKCNIDADDRGKSFIFWKVREISESENDITQDFRK